MSILDTNPKFKHGRGLQEFSESVMNSKFQPQYRVSLIQTDMMGNVQVRKGPPEKDYLITESNKINMSLHEYAS